MKTPPTDYKPLPEPLEDTIRKRAFEIYEQHGKQDGYELDDWLSIASSACKHMRPKWSTTKRQASSCLILNPDLSARMKIARVMRGPQIGKPGCRCVTSELNDESEKNFKANSASQPKSAAAD